MLSPLDALTAEYEAWKWRSPRRLPCCGVAGNRALRRVAGACRMMHPLDVLTFAIGAGAVYAGLNLALFWIITGALARIF